MLLLFFDAGKRKEKNGNRKVTLGGNKVHVNLGRMIRENGGLGNKAANKDATESIKEKERWIHLVIL